MSARSVSGLSGRLGGGLETALLGGAGSVRERGARHPDEPWDVGRRIQRGSGEFGAGGDGSLVQGTEKRVDGIDVVFDALEGVWQ